jgi:curved DNA-binding protein CbpA
MKDYYGILGISKNASPSEIRTAYINRSRILHPDRFDPQKQAKEWKLANEMMKELNEAYNILKDLTSKAKYDSSFNTANTKETKYESSKQEKSDKEQDDTPRQSAKSSDSKPKNPGTTVFLNELAEHLRSLLKEMQNKGQGDNFYGVKYKSVYSSYFIAAAILIGFFIIFNASESSLWTTEGKGFVFLLSLGGSIYLFKSEPLAKVFVKFFLFNLSKGFYGNSIT